MNPFWSDVVELDHSRLASRIEVFRSTVWARPVILHGCHNSSMIDLGTLAGLLEHGHKLAAYCQYCDRWAELDLGAMVSVGLGGRQLPVKVRCQVCGEVGRLQVRPPVPTRGPGGWMEPPTTGTCRPPPLGQPPAAAGKA